MGGQLPPGFSAEMVDPRVRLQSSEELRMVTGRTDKTVPGDCEASGPEIDRYGPFAHNCEHPPGSSLMMWLLTLFLLFMYAGWVAFMVYCACHAEAYAR